VRDVADGRLKGPRVLLMAGRYVVRGRRLAVGSVPPTNDADDADKPSQARPDARQSCLAPMARITEPRPAPTSASRGAAAATVDEAASSSSGGSSPDLGPVDLNLTEEEQAFLAREALGSLPPSEVPDVAGPKLVDAIPETIFMSADDVRAAARRQEEEEGEDEIFKAAILVRPLSFIRPLVGCNWLTPH
jgi:hypothetical protein